MRNNGLLRSSWGFSLAALLLTSSAFAQTSPRDVVVTIAPVSTQVTFSRPATTKTPILPALDSYVAWLVTITNQSGNTINNVYFVPDLQSTPTGLAKTFVFDAGSPCVQDSSGSVSCPVGQIQAQSPTASFVIFYKAPLAPDPLVASSFSLGGTVYFAEGTTDNSSSPPNSSYVVPTNQLGVVNLGTSNPVLVKSSVRKGGGGIFTGEGGVPTGATADSQNAALLAVPPLPGTNNYGFSQLKISAPSTSSSAPASDKCPSNTNCLTFFDVTVTDKDPTTYTGTTTFLFSPPLVTDATTQYLLITLRRDASLFTGSINNATIYYYYSTGWALVPPCAQVIDPLASVERCVYDRKVFKTSDPEVQANPGLKGDAQIRVLAKGNGRLVW